MTIITVNWLWLMHINQDVKYLISIDWSQLIKLWGFCKHMLPFWRCSFGFSFLSFLIRSPFTIVVSLSLWPSDTLPAFNTFSSVLLSWLLVSNKGTSTQQSELNKIHSSLQHLFVFESQRKITHTSVNLSPRSTKYLSICWIICL